VRAILYKKYGGHGETGAPLAIGSVNREGPVGSRTRRQRPGGEYEAKKRNEHLKKLFKEKPTKKKKGIDGNEGKHHQSTQGAKKNTPLSTVKKKSTKLLRVTH